MSASVAACAATYSAYVLYTSADHEAGNVAANHSMCAAFSLLACTLVSAGTPNFKRAKVALGVFKSFAFVVGMLSAWAAWSIPGAGATEMLGIVALVLLLPLLGLISVASVGLTIGALAARLPVFRRILNQLIGS